MKLRIYKGELILLALVPLGVLKALHFDTVIDAGITSLVAALAIVCRPKQLKYD